MQQARLAHDFMGYGDLIACKTGINIPQLNPVLLFGSIELYEKIQAAEKYFNSENYSIYDYDSAVDKSRLLNKYKKVNPLYCMHMDLEDKNELLNNRKIMHVDISATETLKSIKLLCSLDAPNKLGQVKSWVAK